MIIYLDLLIILNIIYDYLILYVVSMVLKRNINKKRLLLSSLIGELSILLLLLKTNYIIILITKLLLALLMNIISFKYKDIRYTIINLCYFYMISIILGGFIYYCYLNNINYLLIMLLIPLLLTIFIILFNDKHKYQNYFDVVININDKHKINLVGYLDTGNNLIDPVSLKPIIVINKELIKFKIKYYYLIPIQVLNNNLLLKCIKINNITINNKVINNVMLGISDTKINIDGVDCLLNNKLRKELTYD